ncbi:hypothetical protein [Bradyrhizobium sp. JYMT SZCCT0428]|uniref:hypothetical protein n=1 Tax=Bradyrhizobium sp. JYMT SZCCT0428 TaxID=2807673 RepID=UPI001BAC4973|nr:hypothetical protein [Bradyrhizobium sp. JYMT SZCCT0428]MBR1156094.1 hypothetical protein [Bradyrhizobium sp. JYMT SZCCT0428]
MTEAPEDLAREIFDPASLLGVVLGPDADTAIDGCTAWCWKSGSGRKRCEKR